MLNLKNAKPSDLDLLSSVSIPDQLRSGFGVFKLNLIGLKKKGIFSPKKAEEAVIIFSPVSITSINSFITEIKLTSEVGLSLGLYIVKTPNGFNNLHTILVKNLNTNFDETLISTEIISAEIVYNNVIVNKII